MSKLTPAQIKVAVEAVRMVPSQSLPQRLTPLEAQVAEIRQSVPSFVILLVMTGYKMKVFGRDSHVLSRRMGVMCIGAGAGDAGGVSSPFEHSSFPVQRMEYYTSRLVSMGYVVGIVDQAETAAGREVGKEEGCGGKSVFAREVTRVLSPGTTFEFTGLLKMDAGKSSTTAAAEEDDDGDDAQGDVGDAPVSDRTASDHNIWYIFESPDGNTHMLIVSISTGTYARKTIIAGEVLADAFKEVSMVYDPVEVVIASPPSQPVSDLLVSCFIGSLQYGPTRDGSEDSAKVPLLILEGMKGASSVASVDDVAKIHLTFMGVYDTYLLATETPYLYRRPECMYLPASALHALEVFYGSYRHRTTMGSLFHLLNRCLTTGGSRMLKRWVASPLCALEGIASRHAAIDEAMGADGRLAKLLVDLQGMDMEGTLSRLSAGRCGVVEYRSFLRRLTSLHENATQFVSSYTCSSALLNSLFVPLTDASFSNSLSEEALYLRPTPSGVVPTVEWLLLCDPTSITAAPPAVLECQRDLEEAEGQLGVELKEAQTELGLPNLAYKEVSNVPYLLEVPAAAEKKVPTSWQLISRIKGYSRYRTDAITRLVNRRQRAIERRTAAANTYFVNHQLQRYAPTKSDQSSDCPSLRIPFAAAVSAASTMDCLLSLGKLLGTPGYCRPELYEMGVGQPANGFELRDLAHPMQRATNGSYVSSTVSTGADVRAWVLTGPNMGGKSALMRSIAIAALMAQIGAPVAASYARLPIYSSIRTRMGAQDELLAGNSTFMFEIQETNEILQAKDLSTSLVLMDELGRGTSSYDGMSVADATLSYLSQRTGFVVFVTHYSAIAQRAKGNPAIELRYMGFEQIPSGVDGAPPRLVFLYQPVPGITPSSFGIEVARLAHLPDSVVTEARARSGAAEASFLVRRAIKRLRDDDDQ